VGPIHLLRRMPFFVHLEWSSTAPLRTGSAPLQNTLACFVFCFRFFFRQKRPPRSHSGNFPQQTKPQPSSSKPKTFPAQKRGSSAPELHGHRPRAFSTASCACHNFEREDIAGAVVLRFGSRKWPGFFVCPQRLTGFFSERSSEKHKAIFT